MNEEDYGLKTWDAVLDFQKADSYVYTVNNPLKYVDPSGNRFDAEGGAGGGYGYKENLDIEQKPGNNSRNLITDTGLVDFMLFLLPGGEEPSETELAQVENIIQKYEQQLVPYYEDLLDAKTIERIPDFKPILDSLGKEILPFAEKHKKDFTWWYHMVKPYGPLDIKNRPPIIVGGKRVQIWNQPYRYDGKSYNGDAGGNILYGFVGAEVFGTGMYGRAILKSGAGAGQLLSDKNVLGWNNALKKFSISCVKGNWGDNPGDAKLIEIGINAYEETKYPGQLPIIRIPQKYLERLKSEASWSIHLMRRIKGFR